MKYEIITDEIDHKVLADVFEDPQAWVQKITDMEVAKRRRNLVVRKTAEDIANSEVSNIVADEDTILDSVFNATDYKTVAEKTADRAAISSREAT